METLQPYFLHFYRKQPVMLSYWTIVKAEHFYGW
jgi:hypothetical protein